LSKNFGVEFTFTTRVKVTPFFGVKLTPYLLELKRLWIWSHSVTVDLTLFPELNLLDTGVKVTLFLGVKLTLKLPELKLLWIWSHSVTIDLTLFPELNLLHN
jgi:NAD(P)H-flavin reductase